MGRSGPVVIRLWAGEQTDPVLYSSEHKKVRKDTFTEPDNT